jgi:hypothetical protein
MPQKWIPKKADAGRAERARKAKALRAKRRGVAALREEASRRADVGVERMKGELGPDQAVQSDSGKRQ